MKIIFGIVIGILIWQTLCLLVDLIFDSYEDSCRYFSIGIYSIIAFIIRSISKIFDNIKEKIDFKRDTEKDVILVKKNLQKKIDWIVENKEEYIEEYENRKNTASDKYLNRIESRIKYWKRKEKKYRKFENKVNKILDKRIENLIK